MDGAMPTVDDEFLMHLLRACAGAAPAPLYPSRYSQEALVDRDRLDEGLDELRRRGLVKLTEWVKGLGQGCALTEAGEHALSTKRLTSAPAPARSAPTRSGGPVSAYQRGEMVRDVF